MILSAQSTSYNYTTAKKNCFLTLSCRDVIDSQKRYMLWGCVLISATNDWAQLRSHKSTENFPVHWNTDKFFARYVHGYCHHNARKYVGESNENCKTEIKIRNIAPLSYKLADMLPRFKDGLKMAAPLCTLTEEQHFVICFLIGEGAKPETKRMCKEWRHSSSPKPKKFRKQPSSGKIMLSFGTTEPWTWSIYTPRVYTITSASYQISWRIIFDLQSDESDADFCLEESFCNMIMLGPILPLQQLQQCKTCTFGYRSPSATW
jgi:hypothetical protein